MSKYNGKSFGQILREKRKERGWSQRQLGGLIKIPQQTITAWENGINEPMLYSAILLADVFECTIDELVGRTM